MSCVAQVTYRLASGAVFVKRHRLLFHEEKCQTRLAGALITHSTIPLPPRYPSPTPSTELSPNWTLFESSPTAALFGGETDVPSYSLPSPATSLLDDMFLPDIQLPVTEDISKFQLEDLFNVFSDMQKHEMDVGLTGYCYDGPAMTDDPLPSSGLECYLLSNHHKTSVAGGGKHFGVEMSTSREFGPAGDLSLSQLLAEYIISQE
ncbi:hypothetical protein M427DRAFT_67533 [Gonapodya prolifera JEL478]|uniref:Uncharacterized protein n=1 Tax=Gonapodya prolifera (strain JEL478) TaxID=1344416 RepID=A0A139AQC7_GONPJ|nr:hypothetical protein M427DRAFT_67533 [Gonapodya prolifera JEL478]|eukprot:KXS18950.1 hypothetical protein M427DRAFT_67533 [Gonapodya prolifera JEL478]